MIMELMLEPPHQEINNYHKIECTPRIAFIFCVILHA